MLRCSIAPNIGECNRSISKGHDLREPAGGPPILCDCSICCSLIVGLLFRKMLFVWSQSRLFGGMEILDPCSRDRIESSSSSVLYKEPE